LYDLWICKVLAQEISFACWLVHHNYPAEHRSQLTRTTDNRG